MRTFYTSSRAALAGRRAGHIACRPRLAASLAARPGGDHRESCRYAEARQPTITAGLPGSGSFGGLLVVAAETQVPDRRRVARARAVPPAGRASGPTTRGGPPAVEGLRPEPRRSGSLPAPVTRRRRSDQSADRQGNTTLAVGGPAR